jgi:hypothetical protein
LPKKKKKKEKEPLNLKGFDRTTCYLYTNIYVTIMAPFQMPCFRNLKKYCASINPHSSHEYTRLEMIGKWGDSQNHP